MRKLRKTLSVLLSVVMAFSMLSAMPFSAFAASGTCGANATWTFENGTLTISGSGDMDDYDGDENPPWEAYSDDITSVVIGSAVTSVGAYAFYGYNNLNDVTLGSAVSILKRNSFSGSSVKEITFEGSSIDSVASGAFSNVTGAVFNFPSSFTLNYPVASQTINPTEITTANYSNYFGNKNFAFFADSITVYWVNENGTILEIDANVTSGTVPTYDGEEPTKTNCVFAGWTPSVEAVTDNAIYTANFSNAYTVTWKNWDGTVLETDTDVAEGTTPSYDGETPTRPDEGTTIYTFTGWDPVPAPITSDMKYIAEYEANSVSPWIELQQAIDEATDGSTVTLQKDYTALETDSALVIPESKTLTLDLNGHTLDRRLSGGEAVANGSVIANYGKLTITDDSENGSGVITGGNTNDAGGGIYCNYRNSSSTSLVIEGGTITGNSAKYGGGVWTSRPLIMNGGSVSGNTATNLGGGICFNGGSTYGIQLNGGEIKNNTAGNLGGGVFNGDYTELRDCTISGNTATNQGGGIYNGGTLKFYSGSVLGNTAAQGGGVFSYEDSSYDNHNLELYGTATITGNTAELGGGAYTRGKNVFLSGEPQITDNTKTTGDADNLYISDNTQMNVQNGFTADARIGVGATLSSTPSLVLTSGLAQSGANYEVFSSDISNRTIVDDGNGEAAFVRIYNIRTLRSGNGKGTVTVDKKTALAGDTVTVTATPKEGYELTSLKVNNSDISGNSFTVPSSTSDNIYVIYEFSIKEYIVTWKDEDGTVLETDENVTHGSAPSFDGTIPSKEGYHLVGWDDGENIYAVADLPEVTGNVTYKAVFAINTYTVTWQDENGTQIEKDENVPHGATPVYSGDEPTKTGWHLVGWTDGQSTYAPDDLPAVTDNVTYKAVFEINKYTVTWMNGDDVLETDENVPYGSMPEYNGEALEDYTDYSGDITHYTFTGWTPDISAVAGDVTYTATYTVADHIYSEPVWSWIEDGKSATAVFSCSVGGETETVGAAITAQNETDRIIYTATVQFEGNTYTDEKPVYKKYSTITVASMENGTVEASAAEAYEGDEITLTNTPDTDYRLVSYTVTDEEGGEIAVTDGKFIMPASAVTVNAEFAIPTYVEQVEPYIDENGAYILGTVKHFTDVNGVNYAVNADGTVGDVITSLELSYFEFQLLSNDTYRINYYTGSTAISEFVIPKTYNGKKITVIGPDKEETTLSKKGNTAGYAYKLVLNENITTITQYAFWGKYVTEVTGDTSGLTYIGKAAFSWANGMNNYNLKLHLTHPGNVTLGIMSMNNEKVTVYIPHTTTVTAKNTLEASISYVMTDAHTYGTPSWKWAEDYSSATVSVTCKHNRCGHKETAAATVSAEADETDDKYIYTATATIDGTTYTDTKEAGIRHNITINASTNGTVSCENDGACKDDEITLTITPDENYVLDSLSVKDADENDVTVTDGRFTMPASDVTVTAIFKQIPVDYVDAYGNTLTLTKPYTIMNENTVNMGVAGEETWYVLKGEVTNANYLRVMGDVNIILCDGAKLTDPRGIGVYENEGNLTIYGQREGTGELYIEKVAGYGGYAAIGGMQDKNSGVITINSGTVTAYGEYAGTGIGGSIRSNGTVIINGGTVNAKGSKFCAAIGGGPHGNGYITINGGNVNADGTIGGFDDGTGTINLGWTNSTDSIKATKYQGTVTLLKAFADEDGVIYTPTDSEDADLIAGKTLVPSDDHNHAYGTPDWTWATDYSSAKLVFGCNDCQKQKAVNATVTKENRDNKHIYTATVTIDGVTYTDIKELPFETPQDIYNLTVEENIDVNILIDVRRHAENDEIIDYIEYTYPDITTQEKKTVTETVNAEDITTDANGYFAKSFTMAVAQANEPISATLYFTNGETSDPLVVSVANYCNYIINNAAAKGYSEELVNLCYAVLDYGKNAANYFNYEYEAYPQYTLPDYFNEEVTITSQAGIKKGDVVTGIASTQMFILSEATMRLTFKDDLSSVEVVSAKIGDKALAAAKVKNNGKDAVDISGISATELNQPIVLELSDGTKVQYAATDWAKSILSYSTNAESKALAKSLYFYSKAANDYFA